ncbi:MAG: DUF4340 domain-containing protein [Pseudomonadota bacterium]|nr:DUF4340 domain-containing protein [Pseudomonadota bacterium]
MQKNAFYLLALITLTVVAAAFFTQKRKAPETEIRTTPVFADLLERVNDVSKIEIKSKTEQTVLVKRGATWEVENRGHFPALFEKVKGAVVDLAELQVIERKTANKELYPKLAVEDPAGEGAASRLVTLLGREGQPLASLIIGNPSTGKSAGTYVRLPDKPQALLVKGSLDVPANPMEWLVKDVAHIPSERIREVVIQKPGQALVRVYKDDPKDADYTLDALLKGHEVKSQLTVNSLAASLEYLRFDDVAPRADLKLPADPTVTTLRTFDGLVAIVKSAIVKDKTWASVEFSFDAEAAKKAAAKTGNASSGDGKGGAKAEDKPKPLAPSVAEEVEALSEKTAHWTYVLPSYKGELLTKTVAALTTKEGKNKPSSAPKTTPGS